MTQRGPTAEAVVARVEAQWGRSCDACGLGLIGHEVVLSLLLGWSSAPQCGACLAAAHGREPRDFLSEAARRIARLDCYRAGWMHSDRRLAAAGPWPEERLPAELRLDGGGVEVPQATASQADGGPPEAWDADFDAGDRGCGELVLELRLRMKRLAPAALLRLTAHDPGAPEDLPAWCQLTGHRLRWADPPLYWIERKPDPTERT